jgi:hypothetical protein
VEFIPGVLWSYCTTIRTLTGETPFSLTFGTEALIPIDVGSPSFKVSHYNSGFNDGGIIARKTRSSTSHPGDLSVASISLFQQKCEPQKFQSRRLGFEKSDPASKRPGR